MKTLKCEKLLFGGFGMARTEDQGVVFIDGLLPGETGEVEPAGKRGGIPFFNTVKVTEPSTERRDPPCPWFGECGGCNWLHIKYPAQLKAKRAIFDDAMTRIGKFAEYPEPEIFSGAEFGYRCRVQFHVDSEQETVGFCRRRSHDIIDIDSCPLLSDKLNGLLEHKSVISAIAQKGLFKAIDTGSEVVSTPAMLDVSVAEAEVELGGYKLQVSGDSFFQNNIELVTKLASWCTDILSGNRLLDLYGGTGLFAMFHAKNFRQVIVIERDQKMVKAANKAFQHNLINAKAVASTAENFAGKYEAGHFDVAIVDPPRQGVRKEALTAIAKLAPPQLLYISCNPTTQARDLGILVREHGYKMIKTAIFDLYPNTDHLETGVLLQK
jgi:23S rRNA (uracil1939-C5)-methyltransferase